MVNINTSGFTPQVAYTSKSNGAAAPAQAQVANPTDGVVLSSGTSSSNATQPPVGSPSQGPVSAEGTAPKVKEWTMLVYFASDNNLYPYEVNNLRDAEKVGSTDQMNVVAQMSHAPNPKVSNGHTVRYEVQKCKPGTTSPVKQDLGSVNMGDPKSLSDFIKWGKTNYPANHYMLIVNDHGNGWEGCLADDSHDGWFTLPKLEEGLKDARTGTDGKPLDIIGFDCCLMANIENASQLKDEAKFMVHSEETEGGPGWAYNQILTPKLLESANLALMSRDGLSAKDLATKVVTMAHGHDGDLPTMSALDTSKVPALLDATKAFGEAIKGSKIPNSEIAAAADASQAFYMESDLHDFAGKVAEKSGDKDKTLTDAAKAVQSAVENALIAEEHSNRYPDAHGMTVELTAQGSGRPKSINPAPELQRIEFGQYKDLKFVKETGFNEAVTKFRSSSEAQVAAGVAS